MKCLITGGAGFIGSHLSEALLKKGNLVTIIDDLSTGRLENVEHLRKEKNFSYYIDTIMNHVLMAELVGKCDVIFHLAAAVGVKYVIDHPLETILTNVGGTEIVLSLANEYGNKKVVIASTSEVYGKDRPGKRIFSENDDRVLGPTSINRWGYSCTKALDEFLALAYFKEKKLPVVIVRFFNTCGPRQTGRYGMVVPRFIKQALDGEPITIYGDGKQTRCFTDVSDAVRAVIGLVCESRAIGEALNIGNPHNKITINALAKVIKRITGSKSAIQHIPYEKAYEKGFEDMRHRQPDISKLKSITNFSPRIGIAGMLERIVKDFKQKNKLAQSS
ncbi:MAG: GDP-mannose 4,6-dehydratase [Candidatus Omnitrophota bacterium]|nr:GDP-mannose 4,6-dehydratase [Candidatus Omnitrophota bacterium]